MHRPTSCRLLAFVALLLLAGCAAGHAAPDADGDSPVPRDVPGARDVADPTLLAPGTCASDAVRVLRVNPWPGGGLQIYVVGAPIDAAVTVLEGDRPVADAVAVSSPQTDGFTGVVLEPSADPATMRARQATAALVLRRLPDGERVAAWVARRDAPPLLLADLALAPEAAIERISDLSPSDAVVGAADIDHVRGLLAAAGGRWGTVLKRVVVVSGFAVTRSGADPFPSVGVVFLTAELPTPSAVGQETGHDESSTNDARAAAVETLAARVRAERDGVVRVGVCADAANGREFTLTVGDATCTVVAPRPMTHRAGQACSASAAAADAFDLGDTVDLVMTEAQHAVWEERHANRSKEDFSLSVRLGAGDPVPARAHFRGQTSMDCARKSYDVNLAGGQPRRLMPGGGGDEFYLVSLCKDDGYFRQEFANRLLADWELFPLKSRFVRVRLNGTNHGLYLMVQEPADTLVDLHAALDGVLRRPFEPDPRERHEVKYSARGDAAGVLQDYLDMAAIAQGGGPDVAVALGRRLDLAQYLRWMATMTFLRNGDYVDEVFFYGSADPRGSIRWRIMSWDADDLFSACHHGGAKALEDPWGLLYCAEGFIDEAILAAPDIYAAWVDELRFVMQDVTAVKAKRVMEGIRDDLFALLDDETAAALVEFHAVHPEAVSAAGAKAVIQAVMDEMRADIEHRRATLRGKMETYLAGQQP